MSQDYQPDPYTPLKPLAFTTSQPNAKKRRSNNEDISQNQKVEIYNPEKTNMATLNAIHKVAFPDVSKESIDAS